jgi:hypothetical protein
MSNPVCAGRGPALVAQRLLSALAAILRLIGRKPRSTAMMP